MTYPYTTHCVRCLKTRASIWGGHVLRGRAHVIAGWCAQHLRFAEETTGAWFGHWCAEMGFSKTIPRAKR